MERPMEHSNEHVSLGVLYVRLDLDRRRAEHDGRLVEVLEIEEVMGAVRDALTNDSI